RYLGLGGQPVRITQAKAGAVGKMGVMVNSVAPGGPAEQGGILLGDVVLAFGGVSVSDPGEVMAVLMAQNPGDVVPVRLLRAGEIVEAAITVGEYPQHREG
ncbi:MAG TPA: PDZ domain-containing protein, partial [Longimicrobium sp.]|nr:PDZ domain-containing protein [Longimicrobium sp.]